MAEKVLTETQSPVRGVLKARDKTETWGEGETKEDQVIERRDFCAGRTIKRSTLIL